MRCRHAPQPQLRLQRRRLRRPPQTSSCPGRRMIRPRRLLQPVLAEPDVGCLLPGLATRSFRRRPPGAVQPTTSRSLSRITMLLPFPGLLAPTTEAQPAAGRADRGLDGSLGRRVRASPRAAGPVSGHGGSALLPELHQHCPGCGARGKSDGCAAGTGWDAASARTWWERQVPALTVVHAPPPADPAAAAAAHRCQGEVKAS